VKRGWVRWFDGEGDAPMEDLWEINDNFYWR